jgi:hypothetical protein
VRGFIIKNIFGSVLCQRRFLADITSILIVLAGLALLVPVAKNIFTRIQSGISRLPSIELPAIYHWRLAVFGAHYRAGS